MIFFVLFLLNWIFLGAWWCILGSSIVIMITIAVFSSTRCIPSWVVIGGCCGGCCWWMVVMVILGTGRWTAGNPPLRFALQCRPNEFIFGGRMSSKHGPNDLESSRHSSLEVRHEFRLVVVIARGIFISSIFLEQHDRFVEARHIMFQGLDRTS